MSEKAERIRRYVIDYDARALAEMLVNLEDQYDKLKAKRRPNIQIGENNTMVVNVRRRKP